MPVPWLTIKVGYPQVPVHGQEAGQVELLAGPAVVGVGLVEGAHTDVDPGRVDHR